MKSRSSKELLITNAVLFAFFLPLVLIGFQNCAPKEFSSSSTGTAIIQTCADFNNCPGTTPTPVPTPDPTGDLVLLDQTESTKYGVPITWLASTTGDRTNYTYSFDMASNKTSLDVAGGGNVSVSNASTWELTYSPGTFRGELQITVFARKTDGTIKQANLTLDIGNAVNLLSPALAIRGAGCVTCHAEVHANMITDFGYGNSYYFGQNPPISQLAWNDGLIYGDQYAFLPKADGTTDLGAWWRLNLAKNSDNTGQTVFVPSATLPSGPAGKTGATTLRGYIQHRLNNSYYGDSKSALAVEKTSIFIGAPTGSRLETVFGWTSTDEGHKYKYITDANGRALSGMNVSATGPSGTNYFTNTGNLVCEGDLMLKGTVYLNNLTVDSKNGCRLHVEGSVFIYGPINYVTGTGYDNRNLQITSSKAILMGLGSLYKNGVHCEANSEDSGYWGYYYYRDTYTAGMSASDKAKYLDGISDSAKYRLTYFWGRYGYYERNDSRSGLDIGQDIYNEMMSTIGTQQDAACRPETRNTNYERLLLNAPLVQSRYAGTFKGSIIAEVNLMSLGLAQNQSRFHFEFDPVFQGVDVLPLLQEQDFLQVK